MQREGRSIRGSDEQITTIMVASADVGRIIGKYLSNYTYNDGHDT